jgi:DeoR/GlpR family transcriptional regulator of sugar metabolism
MVIALGDDCSRSSRNQTMIESERHRLILDHLENRQFATVKDLMGILAVSPATIRRDMARLHSTGRVRKVFGGIAAGNGAATPEQLSARPFEENQVLGVEAKRAIAAEAEKLVRDGDALIIHGGTTCFIFAQRLARRSVRIFTNSMPLAAALWDKGTCHLTIAGGELHREPGIIASPSDYSPDFYASKLFIGAQGIGPHGVMESHPLIVREAQKLLSRADRVIVLADSRKFSIRARYTVFALTRIGTLITDDALTDTDAKMLDDAGVRVITAGAARDQSPN